LALWIGAVAATGRTVGAIDHCVSLCCKRDHAEVPEEWDQPSVLVEIKPFEALWAEVGETNNYPKQANA